jgi:hypothetical protein
MATIYEKADDQLVAQMQRMLNTWHPGLRDAGVKVDVVVAHARKDDHGQPMGPAIKHHGVVVAAYVRILGLKDRVMGRGDAEIVLDGDRWDEWATEKQNALFDHELEHLQLRTDAGVVVRDDFNRPLLKIKPHDYEFGWFLSIAERHGEMSFEREQAEKIFVENGQLLFPFAAGVSKPERAEKFLAGRGHRDQKLEVEVTYTSPGRPTRRAKMDPTSPKSVKAAAKELSVGASGMPPA